MRRPRDWDELSESYGGIGENAAWEAAHDHYEHDRLQEAYVIATALGAGHGGMGLFLFRMIEAEWLTRQMSEVWSPEEWLQIETVPGQSKWSNREIESLVLEGIEEVGERFVWAEKVPLMVTFLAREANAPWAPYRHGFYEDKVPYDKVCLPNSLLQDREDALAAVVHEYAHVMANTRSDARCPMWLHEAVAMVAEGGLDDAQADRFAVGSDAWLDPESLDRAFSGDREEKSSQVRISRAYQQSAALGEYLVAIGEEEGGEGQGEPRFGRLLDAHADNGFFGNLMMRVRNQHATDEALRQVYDLTEADLFADALDWLRQT